MYRSSKQDLPAKAAHKVNEFMSHQQLGSTTALVSELYNSVSHQCSAAPGAQLSRPRGPFAPSPIRQKTSGASAGNEEDTKRRRDFTRLHVGQSGLRFPPAWHSIMACAHTVVCTRCSAYRSTIHESYVYQVAARQSSEIGIIAALGTELGISDPAMWTAEPRPRACLR